jgi:hypothetical protein
MDLRGYHRYVATAASRRRKRVNIPALVPNSTGPRRLKWPALLSERRSPLARLLFRCPIWLYHVGLGWVFGHQFLLLTHAGRRTGCVRETVLKVLHYDPVTRESIVASAGASRRTGIGTSRRTPPCPFELEWTVRTTATDASVGRGGRRFRRLDAAPALVCAVDVGSGRTAAGNGRDGASSPRWQFPVRRVQPCR